MKAAFKQWCDAHPDLTREQIGAVFGTDVRTVRRYLSNTTQPHGGILRLMEVFERHPRIDKWLVDKHTAR